MKLSILGLVTLLSLPTMANEILDITKDISCYLESARTKLIINQTKRTATYQGSVKTKINCKKESDGLTCVFPNRQHIFISQSNSTSSERRIDTEQQPYTLFYIYDSGGSRWACRNGKF